MERLPADVIAKLKETFSKFDVDGSGQITSAELGHAFMTIGESVPGYKLRGLIAEIDVDKNGTVNYDEFLKMYLETNSESVGFGQWLQLAEQSDQSTAQSRASQSSPKEGMTHTVRLSDKVAFAEWINKCLRADTECADYIPVSSDSIFSKLENGFILCKMINQSVPKTIDERAINKEQLNASLIRENATLALAAADSIGCTVVNITEDDINNRTEHLLLGILWQIIRIGLFTEINLEKRPGIQILLEEGEEIEDLQKFSPEEILLRWMNYQLKRSGSDRLVNNFSADVKDSEVYAKLLQQIAPDAGLQAATIMNTEDLELRAESVLKAAEKVHCRAFVTARNVVEGNPKLNLAFVANLFRHFPALPAANVDVTQEETLDEKRYRNWMNSMGVNPFVNNLCKDVTDGYLLCQVYEKIEKGSVDFAKVNTPRTSFKQMSARMKKIENCDYVIRIGKEKFGFDLANITGEQIYAGLPDAVLSLVRQMLRAFILNKVKASQDTEVLEMVNKKLQDGGSSTSLKSFKDGSLARKILDLVGAIKPGVVNNDFLGSDELENARYALTMARKLGARHYAFPKDVVDSNEQVMVTVFASIIATNN